MKHHKYCAWTEQKISQSCLVYLYDSAVQRKELLTELNMDNSSQSKVLEEDPGEEKP